jgi:hypothetical protein
MAIDKAKAITPTLFGMDRKIAYADGTL